MNIILNMNKGMTHPIQNLILDIKNSQNYASQLREAALDLDNLNSYNDEEDDDQVVTIQHNKQTSENSDQTIFEKT